MAAETFEQVAKASIASGDELPVWQKFVNTKFFVPIIVAPGGPTADFKFSVLKNPATGNPTLIVSEVMTQVRNAQTSDAVSLVGGEIIQMLHPEVDILVALSDTGFGIPAEQVGLLRNSTQRV